MNASPITFRAQVATARKARAERASITRDVRVVKYSTSTGEARQNYRACGGEHVMTHVEADLPGDRTIGYCECGEYMDTGTWDERNA